MNEEQTTQEMSTEKSEKWSSWQNPVLTPEQWGEVRRAVEAGLSMPEAAKAWGISYETVKKRSLREEWLTENRIKILAEELKAKEALKIENSQKSPAVPLKAAEALSTSLEGYRSQTILSLAKLAKKGVETAAAADLPVENWQDAKIAAEIAMKLHQVGQESVQVNICNAFADMGEGAVVETETEIVSDDEGGDGGRDAYFIEDQ